MRHVLLFGLIATVHFLVTVVLVILTFAAGIARFDTLDAPGWTDTVASSVVNILAFPVLHLLDRQSSVRFPRLWGYVPFAANSLLLAWAIATLWRLRRHVSDRSP